MDDFLGVTAPPGSRVNERVPIGQFPDGGPVALPVVVISGAEDGPTLYLQAGLHGDELTGIEICKKALEMINPAELRGRVVSVPVANIPAYLSRTRGYLHEERWLIDVNRSFPGSADGLLSHRLAHLLLTSFVLPSQLTIDLHSALDGCIIAPFIYLDPADNQAGTLKLRESVARTFGAPYVYRKARGTNLGTSQMANTLSTQGDERGAAVMIAEMGESRRVSHSMVSIGTRGIKNAMITLGMLPGEPTPVPAPQEFSSIHIVHVQCGGGLRLDVELCDEVSEGQHVGTVVDVFGNVVEHLESPVEGFVLRRMELGSVATGAEALWIGR